MYVTGPIAGLLRFNLLDLNQSRKTRLKTSQLFCFRTHCLQNKITLLGSGAEWPKDQA